jgi:hypothetical protein
MSAENEIIYLALAEKNNELSRTFFGDVIINKFIDPLNMFVFYLFNCDHFSRYTMNNFYMIRLILFFCKPGSVTIQLNLLEFGRI